MTFVNFLLLSNKKNIMSDDIEDELAEQIASSILEDIVVDTTQSRKKSKETIKILVGSMSWDGLWTFYVTQDTKISRIKMLTLFELYGNEFDVHVNCYMLTFPSGKRSLHEIKTVKEEHLKNNDELELVKLPASDELLIQFVQHISENTILTKTAHLPKPEEKYKICNVVLDIQPPDVLSTLNRPKNVQLVQKINEWLEETKSILSENLGIPNSFHVDDSIENELAGIYTLFRQYLRASFKVCSKATDNLLEMGFLLPDIQKALRYTGNSTSEAVIYLIGNRDPDNDGAKSGLDKGMSATSDMYKEIMKEKDIIIPLNNPSVLYACLSVMDANSFLVSSIRFPTIMNLLNKILTTYYVTRCDMAIKQMKGEHLND